MTRGTKKDIFKDLDLTDKQAKLVMQLHKPNTFTGTKRESKFVEECHKNAGYCWNDNNTKRAVISRSMNNPRIAEARQRYIQFLMGKDRDVLQLEIINTLKLRAYYDASVFYEDNGTPKLLKDIPKEYREACLSGIENKMTGGQSPTRYINYKLPDKEKAQRELMNVFSMFKESESEIAIKIKQAQDTGNRQNGNSLTQIKLQVIQVND